MRDIPYTYKYWARIRRFTGPGELNVGVFIPWPGQLLMFQNRSGISLLAYTQVLLAVCQWTTSWINVASAQGCHVHALSRKGCHVHLLLSRLHCSPVVNTSLESCMQNPAKKALHAKVCSYHENKRQSVCAWSSSFVLSLFLDISCWGSVDWTPPLTYISEQR